MDNSADQASNPGDWPPESTWYWVAAVYKSVAVGMPRKRNLWMRSVFVFRASDTEDPTVRGNEIARAHEHEYRNAFGRTVRWQLQSVEAVERLFDPDISSGTEVYWQFFERVDRS